MSKIINRIKQNWIKVGLGILVLGALFFVREWGNSSIDPALINIFDFETAKPSATPFIDPVKDCVAYYKNRAISPKSQDLTRVAEVERKPVGEVSLLLIRTDTGKLAHFKASDKPMHNPVFSLDKKKIYYREAYAVTSTAVYEYNLETRRERFITDGLEIMIIPKGQYKGNLIIEKLKYYKDEGSYDWLGIVNPTTGKEIGEPITDIDKFFNDFVCN